MHWKMTRDYSYPTALLMTLPGAWCPLPYHRPIDAPLVLVWETHGWRADARGLREAAPLIYLHQGARAMAAFHDTPEKAAAYAARHPPPARDA